jgi:hypothetical protein
MRIRARRSMPVCAVVAGLVLSGCGNMAGSEGAILREAGTAVQASLPRSGGAQAARLQPTPGFPGLDPSLIAGQTTATMGAYLEDRQALAALVPSGRNGAVQTWLTADQIALSLTGGGVLTATRGLGSDLHAADAGQTAALIAAGQGGSAERRHVYLDGLFRPVSVTLTCTVQPAGTETLVLNGRRHATLRFDERCQGAEGPVVNRYWRDASGPVIRQSSQWIGPGVGMVHLQRLVD